MTGTPLPSLADWDSLGFREPMELHGGKQSRVFTVRAGDRRLVAKLTDARFADIELMRLRADVIATLSEASPTVVAPAAVRDGLVAPLHGWFVTATELVEGRVLDTAVPADAALMGTTLAGVHGVFRAAPPEALPRVDTLEAMGGHRLGGLPEQLLHGDFNSTNMLVTDEGVRVFDLDGCGYGPIEFEVGDALYMVAFDSYVSHGSADLYTRFREAFLGGYEQSGADRPEESTINEMINLRVDALDRWVGDLDSAPVGIRTSTPEWLMVLATFVQDWRSRLA